MTETRTITTHECAHAIVAQLCGLDIRSVKIFPRSPRGTLGGICEVVLDEDDADRLDLLVKYQLGGRAAERKASGADSPRSLQDVSTAMTLIAKHLKVTADDPRVADYFQVCEHSLDALMGDRRVWQWVETAASELVRRRRLSHRDIYDCKPKELR